jgi:hypothetical protein
LPLTTDGDRLAAGTAVAQFRSMAGGLLAQLHAGIDAEIAEDVAQVEVDGDVSL